MGRQRVGGPGSKVQGVEGFPQGCGHDCVEDRGRRVSWQGMVVWLGVVFGYSMRDPVQGTGEFLT